MTKHERSTVTFNANIFSNWQQLYRALALSFLRSFVDRVLAGQDLATATTTAHVSKAKMLIYKQFQAVAVAFTEEMKTLSVGAMLHKGNRLAGLKAYLDIDEVLRIRGNQLDSMELS